MPHFSINYIRRLLLWTCVTHVGTYVHALNSSQNVAYWTFPRANLYGDGIYINGGDLYLNGGQGLYSGPIEFVPDGNGPLWKLDLSLPYSKFDDLSVLQELQIFGSADNVYPFYVGGAMFANYDGLMTYGYAHSTLAPG